MKNVYKSKQVKWKKKIIVGGDQANKKAQPESTDRANHYENPTHS